MKAIRWLVSRVHNNTTGTIWSDADSWHFYDAVSPTQTSEIMADDARSPLRAEGGPAPSPPPTKKKSAAVPSSSSPSYKTGPNRYAVLATMEESDREITPATSPRPRVAQPGTKVQTTDEATDELAALSISSTQAQAASSDASAEPSDDDGRSPFGQRRSENHPSPPPEDEDTVVVDDNEEPPTTFELGDRDPAAEVAECRERMNLPPPSTGPAPQTSPPLQQRPPTSAAPPPGLTTCTGTAPPSTLSPPAEPPAQQFWRPNMQPQQHYGPSTEPALAQPMPTWCDSVAVTLQTMEKRWEQQLHFQAAKAQGDREALIGTFGLWLQQQGSELRQAVTAPSHAPVTPGPNQSWIDLINIHPDDAKDVYEKLQDHPPQCRCNPCSQGAPPPNALSRDLLLAGTARFLPARLGWKDDWPADAALPFWVLPQGGESPMWPRWRTYIRALANLENWTEQKKLAVINMAANPQASPNHYLAFDGAMAIHDSVFGTLRHHQERRCRQATLFNQLWVYFCETKFQPGVTRLLLKELDTKIKALEKKEGEEAEPDHTRPPPSSTSASARATASPPSGAVDATPAAGSSAAADDSPAGEGAAEHQYEEIPEAPPPATARVTRPAPAVPPVPPQLPPPRRGSTSPLQVATPLSSPRSAPSSPPPGRQLGLPTPPSPPRPGMPFKWEDWDGLTAPRFHDFTFPIKLKGPASAKRRTGGPPRNPIPAEFLLPPPPTTRLPTMEFHFGHLRLMHEANGYDRDRARDIAAIRVRLAFRNMPQQQYDELLSQVARLQPLPAQGSDVDAELLSWLVKDGSVEYWIHELKLPVAYPPALSLAVMERYMQEAMPRYPVKYHPGDYPLRNRRRSKAAAPMPYLNDELCEI